MQSLITISELVEILETKVKVMNIIITIIIIITLLNAYGKFI